MKKMNLKRYCSARIVGVTAVVGSTLVAAQSFAGMSVEDVTAIKAGITGAEVSYFELAGAVLIVIAGIWGFKQVKKLF